jgi:hypothetical protein
MLEKFQAAGRVLLDPVQDDDLRIFAALERMWSKPPPEFSTWLRHRMPAGRAALFRRVFGEPGPGLENESSPEPPNHPGPSVADTEWPDRGPDAAPPQTTDPSHIISVGNSADTGGAMLVSLCLHRFHRPDRHLDG